MQGEGTKSKDGNDEIQVFQLQGFKHLNSKVKLHLSEGRVYYSSKGWHVGTPDWVASPVFVSRGIDKLRDDLVQDINIAKMATQDYAVSREAVDNIACMEDGTFHKKLVKIREEAQKSLNYLVEHGEEIKAEESEFHARQERAEKERAQQEQARENTKPEPKSLAERDTRTLQEKARAEAIFWKALAGVAVLIAAIVIGWNMGINK
ncbi:hypothetical protein D3C86_1670940 [compost metagenome]